MELILAIGIILAVNEWRDYKNNRRYKKLELEIKRVNRQFYSVEKFARLLEQNNNEVIILKNDLEPVKEFIAKAQVDLETIVQEYELNGIPLHLQRGNPKFDMVEGL
jgi:hypothetical protein